VRAEERTRVEQPGAMGSLLGALCSITLTAEQTGAAAPSQLCKEVVLRRGRGERQEKRA